MTETKHMTLYDLGRIYDDAYENRARLEFPTPEMKRAMHRAGIRAVVEALRDEMLPPKRKVSASNTIVRAIILQKFNEILASDGVDKAAGADTAAKPEAIERSSPAADRIEALEGEVEKLRHEVAAATTLAQLLNKLLGAAEAREARLRAALKAIAVRAGTFEGRGSYIAYVELAGEIEKMADVARNGEEP